MLSLARSSCSTSTIFEKTTADSAKFSKDKLPYELDSYERSKISVGKLIKKFENSGINNSGSSVSELIEQNNPDSSILLISNETKNANLSCVPSEGLDLDPLKQENPEDSTESAAYQNTDLDHGFKGLKSEIIEAEIKSQYEEIQKSIVDTFKRSENSETSTLVKAESLIDEKDEVIPTVAEVPSALEPVAVDLKPLPEGIHDSEGLTEAIDSESEKDGGWSYINENSACGSNLKPDEKPSKIIKSNTTAEATRNLSRPALDMKSKVKSFTKSSIVDKSKGDSAVKSRTAATGKSKIATSGDKTKTLHSVDKAKTLASDENKVRVGKKPDVKSGVLKSSALSATTTKVNSDKTTRVATVCNIKKEIKVNKTLSSVAKSSRPTTLLHSAAPVNKPASTIVDKHSASSRVNKTSTPLESKSTLKNIASSTFNQPSASKVSSLTTVARPATSVYMKKYTFSKKIPPKSSLSASRTRRLSAVLNPMKAPPITARVKKLIVKEVKDNAKNTATTRGESSSTLANRRAASENYKSTSSKLFSASKSEANKKEGAKAPMTKNAGSFPKMMLKSKDRNEFAQSEKK